MSKGWKEAVKRAAPRAAQPATARRPGLGLAVSVVRFSLVTRPKASRRSRPATAKLAALWGFRPGRFFPNGFPPMIWLYRLLYLPLFLVSLPHYGWKMWKRGGYGRDLRHRFGLVPLLPPPSPGRRRIWIQAVSVGELVAVTPLLQELSRRPDTEVVLTTTSSVVR